MSTVPPLPVAEIVSKDVPVALSDVRSGLTVITERASVALKIAQALIVFELAFYLKSISTEFVGEIAVVADVYNCAVILG